MAFFGGPSKDVVLQMAQGVAAAACQIRMLSQLDEATRAEVTKSMLADGAPLTMLELVRMAGSVVREQNLGWLRKNQYYGMIYGSLLAMGVPAHDARYIKGQIELS